MSLSSVSIRRPVFTMVMSIVIIIFGLVSMRSVGVREYPQAERPIVSVRATYPGASPQVMESQVTEPLEEQINTVAGIESLVSITREGVASVIVEFGFNDDLDVAANDVRDRVSAAIGRLPPDMDPPIVEKADAEGDPIVFLNVKSGNRDLLDLTDIADRLFKARLQTIPGVASVDIWGEKEYSMRLWLDPARLAAYRMSPLDVRDALRAANVELPSGRLEGKAIDVSVRTLSRLGDDVREFEDIILRRDPGGATVQLRDVARVEIGPLNTRTVLKRDGVPMVGVVLRPQAGANQIAIVDEFYKRIERIRADLPSDVDIAIGFDTSRFIRNSISEVRQTFLLALALVCLTIFLFLRETRSALIPLVTIPIAIIGTFFLIKIFGFTVNVLTLLGLVLAIGIVVDDAVVVLENIYAKIEKGMDPYEAGIAGIREIFLAVIATTLALVAVFMPLLFLGGLTGFLFREFGVTLAGAVVISSFVALTLTPMLCTRLLKPHSQHNRFYALTEPVFVSLNRGYQHSLQAILDHRWLAGVAMLVALGGAWVFWKVLPRELAPLEDRSLMVLRVQGPEGANFDYMSEVMDEADRIITDSTPELDALLSVTSPGFGASTTVNTGFGRIVLKDPSERERGQGEIAADLGRRLQNIAGAQVFISQPATLSVGGRGLPVQFVVQNPNFERLKEVLPKFMQEAQQRPEFSFVNVDLKFNRPEVEVIIDRTRAQTLGVSVRDIAETLQAALSEQRFGFFIRDGKQYQVIGQLERADREAPPDLARITLRTRDGELVTLDNLVTLRESTSPGVLYRYNRFPSATFSANLADGYTLGDGIAAMEQIADGVLDGSFTTELSGESREFSSSNRSLALVFLFALVLVYLVLAAQFESFRSPMIILLTVPLAVSGGLFGLWYFDQTLNIFSQIGLVMLIGLVTKNGILLVEFANQRRDAGMQLREAMEGAAQARFRPILMTAISTILGTLPIALALGAGAQSRVPLGIVVVTGMLFGTFLTLYVIPVAYTLFAGKRPTLPS